MEQTDESLLTKLPDPATIHRRLGAIIREEAILRRLLPLAIRAQEEQHLREEDRADCAQPT